jgi:hypothetical protein
MKIKILNALSMALQALQIALEYLLRGLNWLLAFIGFVPSYIFHRIKIGVIQAKREAGK